MELKEFTIKILEMFECNEPKEFPRKVKEALFSATPSKYLDGYVNICDDLSVDHLQRIYQFYNADRAEKKQDYTPPSLAKLVAHLSYSAGQKVVYDCCAGSGALTIQKWVTDNNLTFVCEELDEQVIPILLFNLSVRNIEAIVLRKNILSQEIYEVYELHKGERYSKIQQVLYESPVAPDVAISNPPFSLKYAVKKNDIRYLEIVPPASNTNFAFVLNALSLCDKAVFILPTGVLTSKNEKGCRQKLLEKGWLKTVITLPGRMFESTSVTTCILVFDKQKRSKDVMIVDASNISTPIIREQRGEGDASHFYRVYKKEFNALSDVQIASIIELTEKESHNVSMLVPYEKAAEHDFNLSPGLYKELEFNENIIHRGYNEIVEDINRVIRERNVIKLTVNKVWANTLNLTEIAKMNKESNEIVRQINKALKQLGLKCEILNNKYINISTDKELRIENTDKEILSSLLLIFMPMYRQHVYFLNNEENRLLAELRDAMLPDLLSGKLTFEDTNN